MWVMDIPLSVLTRLKIEGRKALSADDYPNLNITDESREMSNPKFPTVYLQDLGGAERGQDLQGTSVNAVLSTLQIDVIDNKSQSNVREVMGEMVRIMKIIGYSVVTMPNFQNTTDSTYRMVARFRRMIGYGDKF